MFFFQKQVFLFFFDSYWIEIFYYHFYVAMYYKWWYNLIDSQIISSKNLKFKLISSSWGIGSKPTGKTIHINIQIVFKTHLNVPWIDIFNPKIFQPFYVKISDMYETHGRGQFKIRSKTSLNITWKSFCLRL